MTDDPKLRTIRGLLAKAAADSGATDAEREIYAAKAAEMMARHMVTEAMVDATRCADDPIEHRLVQIPPPYQEPKIILCGAIAAKLGCKGVVAVGGAAVHVYGHQSDLARAELLYTSLLLHATQMAQNARPSQSVRSTPSRLRAYRRAWYLGFAARIAARLDTGREHAVRETSGAELVLRDRKTAVDAAARTAHPRTKALGDRSTRSLTGFAAGAAAANHADLNQPRIGGRRAIGR